MIDMIVKAQICFPGSRASREDYDSQDGNWQLIFSKSEQRQKLARQPKRCRMTSVLGFGSFWARFFDSDEGDEGDDEETFNSEVEGGSRPFPWT